MSLIGINKAYCQSTVLYTCSICRCCICVCAWEWDVYKIHIFCISSACICLLLIFFFLNFWALIIFCTCASCICMGVTNFESHDFSNVFSFLSRVTIVRSEWCKPTFRGRYNCKKTHIQIVELMGVKHTHKLFLYVVQMLIFYDNGENRQNTWQIDIRCFATSLAPRDSDAAFFSSWNQFKS